MKPSATLIVLACAWVLWAQWRAGPTPAVMAPSHVERFRALDAYEDKAACLAAGAALEAANAAHYTPPKPVAWRCLPQGMPPGEAR